MSYYNDILFIEEKITVYIDCTDTINENSICCDKRYLHLYAILSTIYETKFIFYKESGNELKSQISGKFLFVDDVDDMYIAIDRDSSGIKLFISEKIMKAEIIKNIYCCSLNFIESLGDINNQSFVEIARKKLLYNELSDQYEFIIDKNTYSECCFLDNILKTSNINSGIILDCCCGIGRHDDFLNKRGYSIDAIDLSPKQIENAKKKNLRNGVRYFIGDIRTYPICPNKYNGCICMWTSINYLSPNIEMDQVFSNIAYGMKKNGIFILDMKNFTKSDEWKIYEKKIENDELIIRILVIKEIRDRIQCSKYLYFTFNKITQAKGFFIDEELVHVYTVKDIEEFCKPNFSIKSLYGGFNFEKYDEKKSDRLIMVLEKK